jgi:cytochrome c biogenesis protein
MPVQLLTIRKGIMAKQRKSVGAAFIAALASLRLSIFLFLTLAVTSAFGTLIQQQKNAATYIASYGPTLSKLILALNFTDMYHSWWFQLLLALLLVNTLVCSFRRLPSALRLMRREQLCYTPELQKRKLRTSWKVDAANCDLVGETLRKEFGNVDAEKVEETTGAPTERRWFAQKQRWARMGPYVAHISLALFFLGGLIGARYGMKGYVTITEGTAKSSVNLRSGGSLELPFEVACLKFELHKYPDGRPSDYLSYLEVRQDGRVIQTKTIEVNDPLIQDGIFFYQSNYGGSDGGALLNIFDREGNTLIQSRLLAEEQMVRLPGSKLSLEVLATFEDMNGYGPAAELVLVSTEAGGHEHVGNAFFAFKRLPDYDKRRNAEHIVTLVDIKPPKRYTGLQVAKDPGVPLIWAGSCLLILGTMVSSFASHRRVWVALEGDELTLAGLAAKNKEGFEEHFTKLAAALREATEAEPQNTDDTDGT